METRPGVNLKIDMPTMENLTEVKLPGLEVHPGDEKGCWVGKDFYDGVETGGTINS